MSKVVLIPNEDKVYAVPTEICEKYELQGAELEAAQEALTPDVEGQTFRDKSGRAWDYAGKDQYGNFQYKRAPWHDR